jgi:signal transduction histidine kinase
VGFDLHDDVCQELVGIGILIESVQGRLGASPPETPHVLTRATRYLSEVVEHLRLLARDLRPMSLHDLGLEASLRSLAAGLSSDQTTVQTRCHA